MQRLTFTIVIGILFFSCNSPAQESRGTEQNSVDTYSMKKNDEYPVQKSEAEWRAQLGDKKYHILREKGTEYPRTGKYNLHFEKGTYVCGACHTPLFESGQKFESDCGWPSFDDSIDGTIEFVKDTSHGMVRTETLCANCGSHLGHIFNDGLTETGQRYCINSLSLEFKEEQ